MGKLLITGGAGFIGSHTCLDLLHAGHRLVVLDDFSNSSPIALERVRELAGHDAADRLSVLQEDIRNRSQLDQVFASASSPIDAVIHFAGLKAVGESMQQPLRYWDVNVNGSRCLLEAMHAHDCHTLVFSSSATLYGYPESVPIPETAPIAPINPYGHTKAAVEQMRPTRIPVHRRADRLPSLFQPSWRPSLWTHRGGPCIPNNLFPGEPGSCWLRQRCSVRR